ncbi:MAG: hydrogenase expression/formation C-terminal domain-containing protein [Gammaproteobacteria bacterium]|nr:hydrogenase expression/formation C-terminal domain-containing protein [Gammaproteobacteria bacterium]
MGLKDIPVVGIGPGSQPGEEDGAQLDYIDMPREMGGYQRPILPEADEIRHLSGALQTVEWLESTLDGYRPGDGPAAADISGLDEQSRDMVNQILGEGEVSIQYAGAFRARIQESVLAGVWRVFYLDEGGQPFRDVIEVCDIPILARLTGKSDKRSVPDLSTVRPPPEVMNALPILTEIADRLEHRQPGDKAHVINLTLLPLSPDDTAFLDQALGEGPLSMLSRGYGDCAITSTGIPDVWWVRYFNSTGKLILNTLEIVEVPIVACAAPEDLQASAERFKDLLEPYRDML